MLKVLLFCHINISICTKLHIFAQFGPLNKADVYFFLEFELHFSLVSHHMDKSSHLYLYSAFSRPFLSEHATQLLVQALVLSRLDYCNALLAGLPASSIKPLQLIQSSAARLIFNKLKRMHVTPLFINLHRLPIAACIKFKALMFSYRTTSGSAPLYLNSLLQTYMPSRSLRSASERRITVHPKETQDHFHRLFH